MKKPETVAIHCEVDLNAPGKHAGFVRLPHSVHRSAYGWLPMPIASIRNGDGPKVVVMAGTHGDEYEGQLIVSRLIRDITSDMVQGQLILIPMANFPAAEAGLRTSPIDEGNLNREFPGDPNGTVTEVIAHFIERVVLDGADYLIDLHSGGSSLLYLPSVGIDNCATAEQQARAREYTTAFGLPYAVLSNDCGYGFSTSAAERQVAVAISTELGGAGMVTPGILKMADQGVKRLLGHWGALSGSLIPEEAPSPSRFMWVDPLEHYVYACEDGVFEPLVELGDEVEAGQEAARLHFPESPERPPEVCKFVGSGMVICKRVPARTRRGDCLFHLASDRGDDLVLSDR